MTIFLLTWYFYPRIRIQISVSLNPGLNKACLPKVSLNSLLVQLEVSTTESMGVGTSFANKPSFAKGLGTCWRGDIINMFVQPKFWFINPSRVDRPCSVWFLWQAKNSFSLSVKDFVRYCWSHWSVHCWSEHFLSSNWIKPAVLLSSSAWVYPEEVWSDLDCNSSKGELTQSEGIVSTCCLPGRSWSLFSRNPSMCWRLVETWDTQEHCC